MDSCFLFGNGLSASSYTPFAGISAIGSLLGVELELGYENHGAAGLGIGLKPTLFCPYLKIFVLRKKIWTRYPSFLTELDPKPLKPHLEVLPISCTLTFGRRTADGGRRTADGRTDRLEKLNP